MAYKIDKSFEKYARENPNVFDENGNYISWEKEFVRKSEYLQEYYKEVSGQDFIRDVLVQDRLDDFKSKEEVLPIVAFFEGTGQDEGLHTGKGTGLLKYTFDVSKEGKPQTKAMEVYSDYKGIVRTQNNRFALINLCSYFGRNKYEKNGEGKFQRVSTRVPSECFGIAIDLDYVKVEQLQRLFGRMENEMIPYPTYIVNSGAGVHLYYLFESPVRLKDIQVQRYLGELKRMLTAIVWTGETSLSSYRQYQGIYQDMRVPGSWTKFGYKNKKRCKYIIKAYKTGERVDLLYLERFVDASALPKIDEDGSLYKERLTLEECMERFPKWYQRVVLEGDKKRQRYTQNRGLYEWWKDIIKQEQSPTGYETDIAHVGNRYFCMRVFFVMAKKCNIPFEEAYEDACKELLPIMDKKGKCEREVFTIEDVKAAAVYYEDEYTLWSNDTIAKQTGIRVHLYKTTRRNGRRQDEHLRRARHLRELSSYDQVGRKSKQAIVEEWQQSNPGRKKCDCIRETGLDKKTVYKWWK